MHMREGIAVTCGRKIGPYDCCSVVCGDCLELMKAIPDGAVDAVITDPPYGIAYQSNHFGTLPRGIEGDADTSLRDEFLSWWSGPALVFGSWKRTRPAATRQVLIWDTLGALGMGALDIPWKPAHHEIYVVGFGFCGSRESDVLRFAPVQSMAVNGRVHPHQKPVELLEYLCERVVGETMLDPFLGSGTTAVAAKKLGRHFLGFEISEDYCHIARERIARVEAQPSLFERKPEQLPLGGTEVA